MPQRRSSADSRDLMVKLSCLALISLLALAGMMESNAALRQPVSRQRGGLAVLASSGQQVLSAKAELARAQRREKVQHDARRARAAKLRPVNTKTAAGGAPLALSHGGRERSFHLLVPPSAITMAEADPRGEVALVVYLHCFGCPCSAPAGQEVEEWDALAAQHGFVLMRPCGDVVGTRPSWNAGACCGEAKTQGLDDEGFVQAATERVLAEQKQLNVSWPKIDPHRVHLTGFSNGGYLASILGRRSPKMWASVAPVSGYEYDTVPADTPVPIMVTHGLLDTSVNPLGCCSDHSCCCKISESSGGSCVSVLDFFEKWATTNGCDPERATQAGGGQGRTASQLLLAEPDRSESVSCVQRQGCKADTILCIHNRGKHTVLKPDRQAIAAAKPATASDSSQMIASFIIGQMRAL